MTRLLLFGSFNPITNGHVSTLLVAHQYLVSQGHIVNGVHIIPVSDKYPKPGLLPAKDRVKMCHLAVKNYPFIEVDLREVNSIKKEMIRTKDTLQELQTEYPDDTLYVLFGGDIFEQFEAGVWKPEQVEEISTKYKLLITKRNGFTIPDKWKSKVEYIPFQYDVSSTEIRKLIKEHSSEASKFVDNNVYSFIRSNELY